MNSLYASTYLGEDNELVGKAGGALPGVDVTINFSNFDHLVDSIVKFKRTGSGNGLFLLAMHCHCC
jgi:hypothetical protein